MLCVHIIESTNRKKKQFKKRKLRKIGEKRRTEQEKGEYVRRFEWDGNSQTTERRE